MLNSAGPGHLIPGNFDLDHDSPHAISVKETIVTLFLNSEKYFEPMQQISGHLHFALVQLLLSSLNWTKHLAQTRGEILPGEDEQSCHIRSETCHLPLKYGLKGYTRPAASPPPAYTARNRRKVIGLEKVHCSSVADPEQVSWR